MNFYIFKYYTRIDLLNYIPMIANDGTIYYNELEIRITNKRVFNNEILYEHDNPIENKRYDMFPFLNNKEIFDIVNQKIIKPYKYVRNTYNNFPYKIHDNIEKVYKQFIEMEL